VFTFLEDIKTRYNAILNGIRAFIVRIIRDPTGSVKDFQACLNEDERKALYVCINEKIPRALLRTLWDTSDLDGAGLLHALLQHAINPGDMSVGIKRATKFYVGTGALTNHRKVCAMLPRKRMRKMHSLLPWHNVWVNSRAK
jgi:hypothetical protein